MADLALRLCAAAIGLRRAGIDELDLFVVVHTEMYLGGRPQPIYAHPHESFACELSFTETCPLGSFVVTCNIPVVLDHLSYSALSPGRL